MSRPSISVRKYIKWGDQPEGENTSTLVLTSPFKSFVDTRIYLPVVVPSITPLVLPRSRLQWAFAGSSISTPATNGKPTHTIWKHWVDSNHLAADQVDDQGDMILQQNGEVLERGMMVNPATGLMTAYEECWEDIVVTTGGEDDVGWVLRCEETGGLGKVKGMIIRIGTQMQGILRVGDEIGVARWRLEGGVWGKTIGIGELELWEDELPAFKKGDSLLAKARGSELERVRWICDETFT